MQRKIKKAVIISMGLLWVLLLASCTGNTPKQTQTNQSQVETSQTQDDTSVVEVTPIQEEDNAITDQKTIVKDSSQPSETIAATKLDESKIIEEPKEVQETKEVKEVKETKEETNIQEDEKVEDTSVAEVAPIKTLEVTVVPGVFKNYSAGAVANAPGDIVLFFHADWCPTCVRAEDILNASTLPDNLTVLKVDYDAEKDLKKKYGVKTQTTFVQVDNQGNKVASWYGMRDVEDLVSRIK